MKDIRKEGFNMQAVKGYFADGRFTATDGTVVPNYVHAVLVIGESLVTPSQDDVFKDFDIVADVARAEERHARMEWLERLRQARELASGEPLPNFPPRTPMGEPHGLKG